MQDAAAKPPVGTSYWTASARHAGPSIASLAETISCDVAIIGAGFTGLGAAHHLLAKGVDVIVLEAEDIGHGASGRSAGMAGTRYRQYWSEMAATHGEAKTLRMHALMMEAHQNLQEMLDIYDARDCLHAGGQLIPAHHESKLEALAADAAWLARHADDTAAQILGREEFAGRTGLEGYVGGWFDPRGGAVHPLDFVRAISNGLVKRGLRLFGKSPVTALTETEKGITVETPGGAVHAGSVLVAGNAYLGSRLTTPDLSKRIVPVASSVIVTEPLSSNIARTVLPEGQVASDTRRIMHAYRRLPDDRILFSGRADVTGKRAGDAQIYERLVTALGRTMPSAAEAAITYRWSGFVGMTRDSLPHVGRLSPRIIYAMGYSGRGIVLSHLLGRLSARLAMGETIDACLLGEHGFRRWPGHGVRAPFLQFMVWFYDQIDRLETRRAHAPAST